MSSAKLITQAHLQQAMERSKTLTEDKVSDLSATLTATKAPMYTYSTTDLTAGSSALETGKQYLVYE